MLPFLLAFVIVMLGMPSLIQLALQKNLLDEPLEDRKVHKRSVPRLGGVLVFIGAIFTTTLLVRPEGAEAISFLRLAAGAMVLFFLGLKDDLSELDPIKKLNKESFKIDDDYELVYETYGPVLRKKEDDGNFSYLSVKREMRLDLDKLKSGDYTLEDLVETQERHMRQYEDKHCVLKMGKFGMYLV